MQRMTVFLTVALITLRVGVSWAQHPPGHQSSPNVHVLSHIPLGPFLSTADITMEQELSRPYVYVARRFVPSGIDVISVKDPSHARIIYSWRIEQAALHQGAGSLNPMYLKSHGRYYLTDAFQFGQGGPDHDLGAIVWDVTGLPDTTAFKEVARIRVPEAPGGFHESFSYKHSNGEALLFTTTNSPFAYAWDIDKVVAGSADRGLVGKVPLPESTGGLTKSYHDFYVGYDPATHQDRFYGAGGAGYYVFDVTNLSEPRLLTTLTGIAGMNWGHTFTPTPDGRYAVGETEYQFQPLRIFDLKPGLDGDVKNISRPIGAWTADWQNLAHNHVVRWPYVFVAAYEDGMYVFNMMDPTNPYTVGYWDTFEGPHNARPGTAGNYTWGVYQGAWGVEVRNADGLIVLSDGASGFWAFKLDGFDGWNGHQWGMPNNSSGQDWDNGPDGAPKAGKIS